MEVELTSLHIAKFNANVDKKGPDECWPWLAGPYNTKDGYGTLRVGKRNVGVHRIAFYLANGYWPMNGLHTCDNPGCCNYAHIFDGTKGDNNTDRSKKGRSTKGEDSNLALLTEAEVLRIRELGTRGWRQVDIAAKFSITQANVSFILLRKSWTHV